MMEITTLQCIIEYICLQFSIFQVISYEKLILSNLKKYLSFKLLNIIIHYTWKLNKISFQKPFSKVS